MIVLDFETRSTCDLRKCGSSVYAGHESTEILCLAWSRRNPSPELWVPGEPMPADLRDAIEAGEIFVAHNVSFERQIWKRICHDRMGWPDVPFEQWRCTLSECSRLTLPRSLDGAGAALGLTAQKDDAGHRLMLKMCKPRKKTKHNSATWHESPEDLQRLYEYCKRDVDTQTELAMTVDPLTDAELKVWQLDQRINLRGIPVDRDAITQALEIVSSVQAKTNRKLALLTGNKVKTSRQVKAMRDYLASECDLEIPDLSAGTVRDALNSNISGEAREILELRQQASKASTAKLQAFLNRCDEDNRVRNNLVYHGAATGRWAGAGVQIQNFPRGILNPSEIECVHDLLDSSESMELLLGSPMDCISSSLRSFIRAEDGKRLLVCDFASIEARVLAWIAGQDDLVAVFRDGGDVYKVMASSIYDVSVEEVTKRQRQIGKMAILGLGYGMGFRAFALACKTMAGVDVDLKFAKQVVKAYRDQNERIVAFWRELNSAAIRAVETQKPHRVGRLEITSDEEWLRIQLPSGRQLHYREPELVEVVAPWSDGYDAEIPADPEDEEELTEIGVDLGPWIRGAFRGCFVPKRSLSGVKDFLDPFRVAIREQKEKEERERKGGFDRLKPKEKSAVEVVAAEYEVDPVLLYHAAEAQFLEALAHYESWKGVLRSSRQSLSLDAAKCRQVEESGRDHSTVPGFDMCLDELVNNHSELDWGSDPADKLWTLLRAGFVASPKITDEDILNRSADYVQRLGPTAEAEDPYLEAEADDVDGLKLSQREPQYLKQIQYMSVNLGRKWSRTRTYGGKIGENVVQAIARDFLVESMLRLEQANYPIIATVHDEVISEVPDGQGSLEEFESIMAQVPSWGRGCPIGVEGFESARYRK